ncbi:MAG: hypothetical protein EPO40_36140 [Myxococcaceae bacterium]|nr:MAG: hypothetical protein EPO40_36140 [Myxococcaceae bacterium]
MSPASMWRCALALGMARALLACSTDPTVEDGLRAAEAVAMASEVVGLAQAFAAPTTGLTSDVMAAERSAAVAQAAFTPTGCTRIQLRDNAVRVTFVGECNGPYGMRVLDGALVATVARRGEQLEVALSGELRTRHSTLRPALNVTVSSLAGTTQVEYVGNFTGVGARGSAVSFDGRGVGSLEASCVQLNGSASVTAGSEAWTVLIASYNRCAGGCPMSGGNLILNRASGSQTRIELTGGQGVSVTNANGRAEAASVPCGG